MIQKPKANFIFVMSLHESSTYDINCIYLNIMKQQNTKKWNKGKTNNTNIESAQLFGFPIRYPDFNLLTRSLQLMFGYGSSPEKKLAKKFNKILLFQTIKWKILKTKNTLHIDFRKPRKWNISLIWFTVWQRNWKMKGKFKNFTLLWLQKLINR